MSDKVYYKITYENENHRGFQYKDGLNVNTEPFNPSPDNCCGGGLYYTTLEQLGHFRHFNIGDANIRKVFIPPGTPIVTMYNKTHPKIVKFKSPQIILGNKIKVNSKEAEELLYNTSSANNYWLRYRLVRSPDIKKVESVMKYFPGNSAEELLSVIKVSLAKGNYARVNALIDGGLADVVYSCLMYGCHEFFPYLQDYLKSKVITPNLTKELLTRDETVKKIETYLGDIFCQLLVKHKAIIAGSFVLSMAYNNKFKNNDIDIYVCENQADQFISELTGMLGYPFNYSLRKRKTYQLDDIKRMYNLKILTNNQNKILPNNAKSCEIQIIVIDNYQPYNFVARNFDYIFCQVLYDGNNVWTPDEYTPYSKNLQNIFTYDHLKTGTGYITDYYLKSCKKIYTWDDNAFYRICQTFQRYLKYSERGFKITNMDDLFSIVSQFQIINVESRIPLNEIK